MFIAFKFKKFHIINCSSTLSRCWAWLLRPSRHNCCDHFNTIFEYSLKKNKNNKRKTNSTKPVVISEEVYNSIQCRVFFFFVNSPCFVNCESHPKKKRSKRREEISKIYKIPHFFPSSSRRFLSRSVTFKKCVLRKDKEKVFRRHEKESHGETWLDPPQKLIFMFFKKRKKKVSHSKTEHTTNGGRKRRKKRRRRRTRCEWSGKKKCILISPRQLNSNLSHEPWAVNIF